MKVRIGVGAGGACSTPRELGDLVGGLDQLGFDSLWLSEVLTAPVVDQLVGLCWAAAHHPRLKLGTTMLLPGRNVVRLPLIPPASWKAELEAVWAALGDVQT